MMCVYFMTVAPEGLFESDSGESNFRTCNPLFTRHRAYPLHHGGFLPKLYRLLAPTTRLGGNYFEKVINYL